MKILGIDTTTKFLSLGTYGQGKVCEYNLELGRKHSTLLIVTIKRVLQALGWRPADIDYFACGLGPGSFTGVRVGLAAIKGLAWALKKPVLGISTLDILAQNIQQAQADIVPMIDAKRNLIYCSIYRIKNSTLKRNAPYMLISEEDFFRKVKKNALIFGDAVDLYKKTILARVKNPTILDSEYWYPKGRSIVELALARIKEKKVSSAFDIKPIYLYPKECQIKSVRPKRQKYE